MLLLAVRTSKESDQIRNCQCSSSSIIWIGFASRFDHQSNRKKKSWCM